MNNKQVAEFFVEQHVLQPSQVEDVLSEAELNGKSIEQAMVDGGFVDDLGFYQTIANGLGLDFIDLTEREITPEILRFIPSGLARLHGVLPVEMSGNALRVALVHPLDHAAAEDLRFALGRDIQIVVSQHQVRKQWEAEPDEEKSDPMLLFQERFFRLQRDLIEDKQITYFESEAVAEPTLA